MCTDETEKEFGQYKQSSRFPQVSRWILRNSRFLNVFRFEAVLRRSLYYCSILSLVRPRKGPHRGMKLEMRKDLGLCRGATRRDRTCSLSTADIKLGRWQRSHDSVLMCCGFIFIFFAIVTIVSYRFEPSILIEGQPFSKWYPNEISVTDQEASATQFRRILTGGLQKARTLELQQEEVEDQRRGIGSKHVQREDQTNLPSDALIHSDDSNPLHLVAGLRIFVYELPPKYNSDWLNDSRCSNQLFAAEVALHQILLRSPVRTMDPDTADFFFVPVYVSCNFSPKNGFPSLSKATKMMRAAVDLISRQMIYWNRTGGSDHIFVATHDYGACFQAMEDVAKAAGVPAFLQKSVILQTFGQQGGQHPCQTADSIIIPPYLPPHSVQKHWRPVEKQERRIWAYFRGKLELHPKNISGQFYSKGIRTRLWQKFKKNRRFFLQRKRLEGYQSEMLSSKFCLAPLGWAPWSPRIAESVLYGCVPVIIADNIALPHSHAIDWPSISLTVREKDLNDLDKILRHVVATNLTTIQENLWKEENRRALLYTQPLLHRDASWHILDLLAQKKLFRQAQKTLEQPKSVFKDIQENQLPAESVSLASI